MQAKDKESKSENNTSGKSSCETHKALGIQPCCFCKHKGRPHKISGNYNKTECSLVTVEPRCLEQFAVIEKKNKNREQDWAGSLPCNVATINHSVPEDLNSLAGQKARRNCCEETKAAAR